MRQNEEPRRCVGSGAPLLLTPAMVYEFVRSTDLPAGTYELMDGIAHLYGAEPVDSNSKCNMIFMLTAAFVAGCIYIGEKEGAGCAVRNI